MFPNQYQTEVLNFSNFSVLNHRDVNDIHYTLKSLAEKFGSPSKITNSQPLQDYLNIDYGCVDDLKKHFVYQEKKSYAQFQKKNEELKEKEKNLRILQEYQQREEKDYSNNKQPNHLRPSINFNCYQMSPALVKFLSSNKMSLPVLKKKIIKHVKLKEIPEINAEELLQDSKKLLASSSSPAIVRNKKSQKNKKMDEFSIRPKILSNNIDEFTKIYSGPAELKDKFQEFYDIRKAMEKYGNNQYPAETIKSKLNRFNSVNEGAYLEKYKNMSMEMIRSDTTNILKSEDVVLKRKSIVEDENLKSLSNSMIEGNFGGFSLGDSNTEKLKNKKYFHKGDIITSPVFKTEEIKKIAGEDQLKARELNQMDNEDGIKAIVIEKNPRIISLNEQSSSDDELQNEETKEEKEFIPKKKYKVNINNNNVQYLDNSKDYRSRFTKFIQKSTDSEIGVLMNKIEKKGPSSLKRHNKIRLAPLKK